MKHVHNADFNLKLIYFSSVFSKSVNLYGEILNSSNLFAAFSVNESEINVI